MWDNWRNEFLRISDKHAPIKHVRVKDRLFPWMNSSIIKLMYKRDYLKAHSVQNDCRDSSEEYRKTRNLITSLIRKSKREYFDQVSAKYKKHPKKIVE